MSVHNGNQYRIFRLTQPDTQETVFIVGFELAMACPSYTHSFQLRRPRSKCMLDPIDLPSSSLQQVLCILSGRACKPETIRTTACVPHCSSISSCRCSSLFHTRWTSFIFTTTTPILFPPLQSTLKASVLSFRCPIDFLNG